MYTHFKKKSKRQIMELEIKLKSARNRLQQVWDDYGCTNDRVLKASRDFDRLENEYRKLLRQIEEKELT